MAIYTSKGSFNFHSAASQGNRLNIVLDLIPVKRYIIYYMFYIGDQAEMPDF